MKTLKKVLSLVLVVAMIASMLIVGAAAAAEETKYDEAVAVVTGLGIIEGDDNGMNFTGNVTREQAAKIIAYLLLGKDTAEALKTSAAPFADVAATRWSAGYIAYLKGQGIINGVTDTEFDPTAPVTGVAFAKMLLAAVGYGAAGEFEGASWDINTLTVANQLGVYAGTEAADLADSATREEAMLYAFNVLTKVPVVNYNKTFEAYYTGASALSPVTGAIDPTAVADGNGAPTPYAYTLAWTNYALKQNANASTSDIFGRPCASWVAKNLTIVENVTNTAPSASFAGAVDSAALYDTFGKTVIDNLNADLANRVVIYTDGVASTGARWTAMAKGEHTNGIYGATIEAYLSLNNGVYTLTLVVVNDHVATVTRVNTANNYIVVTEDAYTVSYDQEWNATYTHTPVTYTISGEVLDITGLAKYDTVIFTKGNDRVGQGTDVVASIAKATPVFGTYTGDNSYGYMIIDGAWYTAAAAADYTTLSMAYDNTYMMYLDRNGSILKANVYATNNSFDYLYVTGAEAQAYSSNVLNGQDAKVAIKAVYPTGGSAVLYYTVKYTVANGYYITVNGADYALSAANVAAINAGSAITSIDGQATATIGGWFSYFTAEDGSVSLQTMSPFYANTTGAITTAANLGVDIVVNGVTYSANSKTVLTKVDALGFVSTYTGVKNFPNATMGADDTVLYTYDFGSTTIKNIVVYTGYSFNSVQLNLAYCAANLGTTTAGTTYQFYVNGASITAVMAPGSCTVGRIYDLTNTFGVYTASPISAYTNTEASNETGAVNAANFKYFDYVTYITSYYEWATVASVDENWFVTVAVANDQDSIDASVAQQAVVAQKYYFDANTVVYDCTAGGAVVDGVEAGDVFVAYVDEAASTAYAGQQYCTTIWIVG